MVQGQRGGPCWVGSEAYRMGRGQQPGESGPRVGGCMADLRPGG